MALTGEKGSCGGNVGGKGFRTEKKKKKLDDPEAGRRGFVNPKKKARKQKSPCHVCFQILAKKKKPTNHYQGGERKVSDKKWAKDMDPLKAEKKEGGTNTRTQRES